MKSGGIGAVLIGLAIDQQQIADDGVFVGDDQVFPVGVGPAGGHGIGQDDMFGICACPSRRMAFVTSMGLVCV